MNNLLRSYLIFQAETSKLHPNLACCLGLYGPGTKNCFYVCKELEKQIQDYFMVCEDYRKFQFQSPQGNVIKTQHAHYFHTVRGGFCTTPAE